MFDAIFPKHWTTLQRLMWLKTNALARAVYEIITGNPVTFSAKAAPLKQLSVAFAPVQAGTGDPSPDNVRPISGWDSLNVWHTGTNVADGVEVAQGAINGATGKNSSSTARLRTGYIFVSAGTYTIYTKPDLANVVRVYDANKTFIGDEGDSATWNANGRTITFTADRYIRIMFSYNMGAQTTIATSDLKYLNVSDVHRSVSVPFGDTYYAGTLNILTGVLTVDSVAKMASSLSWYNNASYANTFNGEGFTTRKRRIDGSNANGCYCDSYKWYTSGEVGSSDGGIALANASSGTVAAQTRIYIKDTRFATAGEFAASLNTNDVKIVCPLAEPLTIQLTPQEVSSLLGENNMWSNANGNLTVTYAADPATTPIVGKGKVGQAVI